MSNDKTLATVKHGGCVRLGDGLLPCPFCGESLTINGVGDGVHSRDSACILAQQVVVVDHAPQVAAWNRRALSAQPSPGGQRDASRLLAAYLGEPHPDLNPEHEISIQTAINAIAYAIAASQPVGEPVAWMTHHDEPMLFPTAAEAAAYCEDDEQPAPLFRSPAQAVDLGTGVKAIAAERERQLHAEGFTRDSDRQYQRGELAKAATAYVQLAAMDLAAGGTRDHIAWHGPAAVWPWAPEWWKPVDARRDLVRAGALIAAQIDLLDSQAVGK